MLGAMNILFSVSINDINLPLYLRKGHLPKSCRWYWLYFYMEYKVDSWFTLWFKTTAIYRAGFHHTKWSIPGSRGIELGINLNIRKTRSSM